MRYRRVRIPDHSRPVGDIARRRVGVDVANRPKRGFTIPVEKWLAVAWSGELRNLASGSLPEEQGWIRPGPLARPIADALASGAAPVQLWYLLVLERWLRS